MSCESWTFAAEIRAVSGGPARRVILPTVAGGSTSSSIATGRPGRDVATPQSGMPAFTHCHRHDRTASLGTCYASLETRTKASLTMSTDRPGFGGRGDAAMFMVTGLGPHGD